jgi:signal peptide peptidase SppA
MKTYDHVLSELYSKPWAILPEKLKEIRAFASRVAAGEKLSDEQIRARIGSGQRSTAARSTGAVAVLPIYGVISQRVNMLTEISGGTSTQKFASSLRQVLSDPNVTSIVFDVDSPGGGVAGVEELSSEIFQARGKKKMVASVNSMAASAAYWIATAADEVVVTPSGSVGSIGVFAVHEDVSRAMEMEGVKTTLISEGPYKTEGNPYEPLSDSARAHLQSQVAAFYSMFVNAVARNRGVSSSAVRTGFGQGRMVLAGNAVNQKMADRVGTLDQVLARFGVGELAATTPALSGVAMARERELVMLGDGSASKRATAAAIRKRELALYQ